MKKIIDYQLVWNRDVNNLVSAVKTHIQSGWQPFGAISVVYSGGTWNYTQAVVRYEE